MKKILTTLVAILSSGILGLSVITNTKTAKADANDTPVVTLGTSLTASQKQGTIDTLTQSLNGANYTTITITGSDLVKYLNPSGYDFTNNSGVWSSAMVQKLVPVVVLMFIFYLITVIITLQLLQLTNIKMLL